MDSSSTMQAPQRRRKDQPEVARNQLCERFV
jgi:hypothetical protein